MQNGGRLYEQIQKRMLTDLLAAIFFMNPNGILIGWIYTGRLVLQTNMTFI